MMPRSHCTGQGEAAAYRDTHSKRLKTVRDIDLTKRKYFEVHVLHGKTITEAFNSLLK
jgi:hypothetical protein